MNRISDMKYIVLLLTFCLFVGCKGKKNAVDTEDLDCWIKTLTVRGEKHEYILYWNGPHVGMTHLPNCKYCETDSVNNKK